MKLMIAEPERAKAPGYPERIAMHSVATTTATVGHPRSHPAAYDCARNAGALAAPGGAGGGAGGGGAVGGGRGEGGGRRGGGGGGGRKTASAGAEAQREGHVQGHARVRGACFEQLQARQEPPGRVRQPRPEEVQVQVLVPLQHGLEVQQLDRGPALRGEREPRSRGGSGAR